MAVTTFGRVIGDAFRTGLHEAARRAPQLKRRDVAGSRPRPLWRRGDGAVVHVR